MRAEANEFAYADAWQLVVDCFAVAFRPPDQISVADYALRHRRLSNAGGGYVGPWSHDEAPYLVEPMQCLTSELYYTTAIVGPGQSGKTEIAHNWLLQSVGADPADFLWYMPAGPLLEAHVKTRIDPLVFDHDVLREGLGDRAGDDTLHFKRFGSMSVQFLPAIHGNMISKSAPRIVADEWDAYPESLGDPKALLDVRRQTFGTKSMLLAISHPDQAGGMEPSRDWQHGIMAIYGESDRRVWWWPCPECGAWSSPSPIASRQMTLHYPADASLDVIERETRLLCPVNGCLIEDWQRRSMNLQGRWLGLGQDMSEDGDVTGDLAPRQTAGFWITGIMSPFLLRGIGGLAAALVKAQRETDVSGEDRSESEVCTKQLGIPYVPRRKIGTLDALTLAERAEPGLRLGVVPEGVRFLTCMVDVQANRFEVLIRGWGEAGESWIVDAWQVPATPATDAVCWDRLFGDLASRKVPLDGDATRGMSIKGIGYDSGGEPGVTLHAYATWRRLRQRNQVRRSGRINGRDAWSIVPMKGQGQPTAPRLAVVYPDTARKDRRANAGGQVPLAQFATDQFKDDLAGQLATMAPGAWHVHFPHGLRGNFGVGPDERNGDPPHLFFEQLVAEARNTRGKWEKPHQGIRNEAMDLLVGAHVVAHLHGLARLDWTRPPSWAAEWQHNSLIGPIDLAQSEQPSGRYGASGMPLFDTEGPPPSSRSIGSMLA
ncbi:MAG: terminase gpA endonuclease subunit [Acetobacteraceae bacterium]